MTLRDNAKLRAEVLTIVEGVKYKGGWADIGTDAILDAVDRHLTQGGPTRSGYHEHAHAPTGELLFYPAVDCPVCALAAAPPQSAPARDVTVYPVCAECGHNSTRHFVDGECEVCRKKCWRRAPARVDSRTPPVSGWRCDSCRDAGCGLCGPVECRECKGRGHVAGDALLEGGMPIDCPACGGTGRSTPPSGDVKP